MKAIQVIYGIDILFLDESLMISQLSLITLQNWSSKKNYKKEFD